MADPRFARLKTDPRFRKPRKKANKIVVDDRFKSIFDDGGQRIENKAQSAKVDKYGRKVSHRQNTDNLRRFYRLEEEKDPNEKEAAPDYARGEVLMESSDEGDETDSEGGEVVFGRDIRKPIVIANDEVEVDLDESQFQELDAQAAANLAKEDDEETATQQQGERTNRLALVNLDWDHVRASHLFQMFSSAFTSRVGSNVVKGKVLSVRVYPSEFGKKRIAREEMEGPPKELFKKREIEEEQDIDEQDLVEEDDGNEYNEEALRKYQLERLRYYYAIITCDTIDAASHLYSELDGTELERSANILDLSFVPSDMTFDDDIRDEATKETSEPHNGVEFVTDALRHSKVKLTWDDDDPERSKVTRRTLSQKEIEESDFKAYLASSSSEDEQLEGGDVPNKREKMRALLLGGNQEDNMLLPEGWGADVDKAGDMEITFTPGLSGTKEGDGEGETTLQQYLRKQKERKKKKKVEKRAKGKGETQDAKEDDFFGEDSDPESDDNAMKNKTVEEQGPSAAAELERLLTSSDKPKHFDMRAVMKAEKGGSTKKGKRRHATHNSRLDEEEAQEDFAINLNDDRFKALHDDPNFAIDPSNPHFKKTKSMKALLEERAKRQHSGAVPKKGQASTAMAEKGERNVQSLVERVKRKSASGFEYGSKRRRL